MEPWAAGGIISYITNLHILTCTTELCKKLQKGKYDYQTIVASAKWKSRAEDFCARVEQEETENNFQLCLEVSWCWNETSIQYLIERRTIENSLFRHMDGLLSYLLLTVLVKYFLQAACFQSRSCVRPSFTGRSHANMLNVQRPVRKYINGVDGASL